MEEQATLQFAGNLALLDYATAEWVKMISGHFYLRDGFKHPDGSMGSMRITPQQLREVLAFAALQERGRCAQIADDAFMFDNSDSDRAVKAIAAAIRKG